MESHEAMKACLGGFVPGKSLYEWFAKKLERSIGLLYQWSRPHEDYSATGTKSDLDRLMDTIDLSLSRPEIHREDSIAPVICLEEHVGRIGVDLEEIRNCSPVDLVRDLSKTYKEFSDLTQTISQDLAANNEINKAPEIQKEGWEAIRQIYTLMKKAERSAK